MNGLACLNTCSDKCFTSDEVGSAFIHDRGGGSRDRFEHLIHDLPASSSGKTHKALLLSDNDLDIGIGIHIYWDLGILPITESHAFGLISVSTALDNNLETDITTPSFPSQTQGSLAVHTRHSRTIANKQTYDTSHLLVYRRTIRCCRFHRSVW